jgi:chromosome segregation ATPase
MQDGDDESLTSRRDDPDVGKLRQLIQDEGSNRDDRVGVLRQRIQEFDDEYDTNRARHELQVETLGKRRDALARQITLLSQIGDDVFEVPQHAQLVQEKSDFDSRLREVNESIHMLKNAVVATGKESADLHQIMWSIPSNNEEIVQIARREIARKIQSELYEVQLRSDDLSDTVSELRADLALSKVVSAGLKKENSEARSRIDSLQQQLDHYDEKRAALLSLLRSSAGEIPLSDLASQLHDLSLKIQRETKDLDSELGARIASHDSEIARLTSELDHTRATVEELNSRIQQPTSTVVGALETSSREVDKARRRPR